MWFHRFPTAKHGRNPAPSSWLREDWKQCPNDRADGAIEEATRKLRRKVDQLQAALEKSRSDLETARKEKAAVNTHLEEIGSKLENAQKELETSKESERQARDQVAQTQASFKALQSSQENGTIEQLRTEIADLKDAVAVSEEARGTAERQRDETNAKLADANKQITAVEQQRDEAFAQLKAGTETEPHTQALLAENGDLKLKLPNLEKNVPANDNSAKVEELVGVEAGGYTAPAATGRKSETESVSRSQNWGALGAVG